MLSYSCQSIDEEDIRAVVEVLRSPFLTQGPAIERFEQKVAEYCGSRYAVAVCNGTAALHIACMALGLTAGDVLWTSPITFVASANCGRYCGADVDFVDIDYTSCNMSVEALAQKLEQAVLVNRLPKVIIPVHFAGRSADMAKIAELARKYDIHLIEDAAHALGAIYHGNRVGCCIYSDMTVFSFHPVKSIATGEGGMVLTNNPDIYSKLVQLRNHGITREQASMTYSMQEPWYYEQLELGFNYRMTDIQAALGASQLNRLEQFIEQRTLLAAVYDKRLSGLPLYLPAVNHEGRSAWHLYVIRLRFEQMKKDRRHVFEELKAAGIGVQVHYIPVHLQPYYRQFGFRSGDFPIAERYYCEAISIPLHCRLLEEEQNYVIEQLVSIVY